jgi:hypothetical protein
LVAIIGSRYGQAKCCISSTPSPHSHPNRSEVIMRSFAMREAGPMKFYGEGDLLVDGWS